MQKAADGVAWVVATTTGAGLLLCAVLIRPGIKASVESTVQCVIGATGGGLQTKGGAGRHAQKLRKMVLEVRAGRLGEA